MAHPTGRDDGRTIRVRRAVAQRPAYAAAAIILLCIGLIALLGPLMPLADPEETSLSDRLRPPFSTGEDGTFHAAGTDQLGRDVLSRAVGGARVSVGIALVTAVIAATIGALLGLLAGYRGGVADQVVMRLVDLQLSFPSLLLAVFLLYLVGTNLFNLLVLLVLFGWAAFARLARAETLQVKHLAFVEGAVAVGAGTPRILLRHILPHLVPTLAVLAVFEFAGVMIAESSLSFLGLGVQPPDSSWGLMLAQGRAYVYTGGWWLFLIPGAALFVTTLCASFASRWLQELTGLRD